MRIVLFGLLSILSFSLLGQLSGKVTGEEGNALAYATIYISGTTQGTTTNLEGDFYLKLSPGEYEIMFQYVGYQSSSKIVRIAEGKEQTITVQLAPESVELEEIVVLADAEDPAYRVIREAIKKRKYFLEKIESYKNRAYVKGLIKMIDAPEKFMGFDIGNMEGILDTNRQGILYLSESESIVYFQQPDQYKEEMISSIVSGDDRGFSFNQATAVDFNFYKNTERFGRKLISPIASNALRFYRYKLIGLGMDQQGRLINKIQVFPKRENDPVYFGHIYIIEDLWNIEQLDLSFTSKSVNQNFFDTIGIRQVHLPVGEDDEWSVFSQVIDFTARFFTFRFGGSFTYIFTNYEINPAFGEEVFSGEIMKVQEDANKKDSSYWELIRPVPLTMEESLDYEKKDSLQELWQSKSYLDSLDRKDNRFKLMNLIFGYRYSQRYKHRYFEYNSPLSSFQFNPVQGALLSLDLRFRQEYDEERKYYSISSKTQYGFGDKKLRPSLRFEWIPENIYDSFFSVEGGRQVSQINQKDPVWVNLNTWTSLFGKNNLLKLYDRKFFEITYQREILNGLKVELGFNYERRDPLQNNTNYSFFKKEEQYEPNRPDHNYFLDHEIRKHDALILDIEAELFLGQKYISYPKQRFRTGSKFPKLKLNYRKGLSLFGTDTDFDQLKFTVYDRRIEMGRLGFSSFQIEAGWTLQESDLSFIDYFHFLGNELHVTGPEQHRSGFLQLPNYAYSTNGSYGSVVYEQYFEGLVMDKIPLLKGWSWETVFGFRYLYQNKDRRYMELSFGIDNISLGPLNLFRFDYVWSLENAELSHHGPVFTLSRIFTAVLD